MKVSLDKMDEAIADILEDYNGTIDDTVNTVLEQSANDCVRELQQTSPKDTGRYARNWRQKMTQSLTGKWVRTVYNQGQARLTHLLENDHYLVSHSGKVIRMMKGRPHIKPAEQHAIEDYETNLRKALNDIR